MHKFRRVAELIDRRGKRDLRILDIGCRRKELGPFVADFGTYHGADMFQTGTVEYVGDFTAGLPVADQSYDVTVALDVIEHTEDMVVALDEMLRVTKDIAIVVLPNHAHWSFRLKFLAQGRISDKFDIRYPLSRDRHRWLTTATQSNDFMAAYCADRKLHLTIMDSQVGRLGPLIEKTIGRFWPDLFNANQMFIIARDTEGVSARALEVAHAD